MIFQHASFHKLFTYNIIKILKDGFNSARFARLKHRLLINFKSRAGWFLPSFFNICW